MNKVIKKSNICTKQLDHLQATTWLYEKLFVQRSSIFFVWYSMSNMSIIIDLISFLGLNYTILNLGLRGYWLPENILFLYFNYYIQNTNILIKK